MKDLLKSPLVLAMLAIVILVIAAFIMSQLKP
jgi:hypothetical protein